MLYYLHKDSVSVLELHPHNCTDMSLYWQLDNKNMLPEDTAWAECVVDAKVKEHPGVLMASGKWARHPVDIDAYEREGDTLADVEQWYRERVQHGQWQREDAAEFGPCGPPPFVIKQRLEAKAATTHDGDTVAKQGRRNLPLTCVNLLVSLMLVILISKRRREAQGNRSGSRAPVRLLRGSVVPKPLKSEKFMMFF